MHPYEWHWVNPHLRPKAVWANRDDRKRHRKTWKETREAKMRADERRFIRGGQ